MGILGLIQQAPENMDDRRIGSEHDGRYQDGMIDEVRIYDRVLTADEVTNNSKVAIYRLPVCSWISDHFATFIMYGLLSL